MQRFEDWEGAARCARRLQAELEPEVARGAWDWYRSSSFISCPVRTAGGRTLGVLAISSRAPQSMLGPEDLRVGRGLRAAWRRSPSSARSCSSARSAAAARSASSTTRARAVSASLEPRGRLRGDRRAGAPARRRPQGRAAPLRAGDGRPAHRRRPTASPSASQRTRSASARA